MNIREKVLEILNTVKPTKNLENINNIIDGGYIDSFELMYLISLLSDGFGIEIGVDNITTENFNSIDEIVAMVEKLKSGK